MALDLTRENNQFNTIIEGTFRGSSWWDITYQAVSLHVPESTVLLYDKQRTYLLYGRALDFEVIQRAELPKGDRTEIPQLDSLDGLTIYYQKGEGPDELQHARLIIHRDGRIFLPKPSPHDDPEHPYEDTILETVKSAREIFADPAYAEAWSYIRD